MRTDPQLTVVALGGNATYPKGIRGTAEEQFEILRRTCEHLAWMATRGNRLVLTHGNGPVIGNILIRMAMASTVVPAMPMDVSVADSQGGMGYMIQQSLANALLAAGVPAPVASVVTQVEVDADDPAFRHPSKPVGPFYTPEEAERIASRTGWEFRDDAGRGHRRVVPSPPPKAIVELEAVRHLVAAGVVPIAAGGGGIPVTRQADGRYRGVAAVIDKDLTGALLALGLGAGLYLNLTGVDSVALDFGTPAERPVPRLSVAEAKAHLEAGQFAEGSMAPKIRAAVQYLEGGGDTVIITSLERVRDALEGKGGTRLARDP
ncbi:MAG TPA: carbamate kinase [Thermodesulfobacteriota bacterium]